MQKRKGKKMTNTKTRSRRKFTAEFKVKVAMEALQERLTLSELSKKYEVHPNLITKWKNQLKEQSTSVFKERGEATDDTKDKLIEQLYKTIRSLTMDVEFLKKKAVAMSKEERKRMVSKEEKLSIRQQCVLLGLCRTSLYYTSLEETAENLEIMRLLDRQYAVTSFYGQRRIQAWLAENAYPVNINRLRMLMGLVQYAAIKSAQVEEGL